MNSPSAMPPRPDFAWLRMLVTLLLAALAAAMTVLTDRDPASRAELRCLPLSETSQATHGAPSATAFGRASAASRADARCLRVTVALATASPAPRQP